MLTLSPPALLARDAEGISVPLHFPAPPLHRIVHRSSISPDRPASLLPIEPLDPKSSAVSRSHRHGVGFGFGGGGADP
jgi:hypothetical protein